MALVSVVMPVYNSAATLSSGVRSVLTQTHSDLKLLVTDDQSCDGSTDLHQGARTRLRNLRRLPPSAVHRRNRNH